MSFQTRLLTEKQEMLPLFPLFSQLNPRISAERYADCLDDMVPRGYRMVVVFDGAECVGMSGIWSATKFYSGKYFELDNVIVSEACRSMGIGKIMCDFIEQLAVAEGIETLMLDAYRENHRGHIFYEKEGFFPRGFHFLKPIGAWAKENVARLPTRFAELDQRIRADELG